MNAENMNAENMNAENMKRAQESSVISSLGDGFAVFGLRGFEYGHASLHGVMTKTQDYKRAQRLRASHVAEFYLYLTGKWDWRTPEDIDYIVFVVESATTIEGIIKQAMAAYDERAKESINP